MASNKGNLQAGLLDSSGPIGDAPSTLYATASGDGHGFVTAPAALSPEALAVQERGETVLIEGTFSNGYIKYRMWAFIAIACVNMLSGIGFLFLFFIPCFITGIKAQFESFRVILSDKTVTFIQGRYACCCVCWGSNERIVPLEKITDATWSQGCLQRNFNIEELNIRTAAGSMGGPEGGAGSTADIHLVGLNDSKGFRTALLKAKDERDHFLATGVRVMDGGSAVNAQAPLAQSLQPGPAAVPSNPETTAALSSIDATLIAIKDLLFEKAENFDAKADPGDVEA
jgi:membrane protein YdbS with pleckstrin-like domain